MPEPTVERRGVRMRSASWLFSAQVANLLIGFPTSIILARVLGPAGKGTLSVVQLIATFAGVLLNLGIGQAFMVYAARREARGRDAVWLSLGAGAVVAAALGLLYIPMGGWVANLLNVQQPVLVLVGLLATGPVLAAQYLNAYVFGSGRIRDASLVSVGSLVLQLILIVALWVLGLLTAEAAVIVWALGTCAVTVALIRLAWHGQAEEGVALGPIKLLARMLPFGLVAWPSGILGSASQRFDVFILAAIKGPAEVGIYSIAVTLAELCNFVPGALGSVLIPKVAAERQGGLEITLRLGRVTWVVTALTGVAVVAVGAPVVPLLFGKSFAASIAPLVAILPGIVMLSMSTSAGAYLSGIGKPVYGTIAAGVNVVTNLAANLILVPHYGATGAALSSTLSYTCAAAVVIFFFLRRSGARVWDLVIPRVDDFTELFAAARRALRRAG